MNKNDLIETLSDFNGAELGHLIEDLETKWGITSTKFNCPNINEPEEDEMGEQIEFTVIVESFSAEKKIPTIKCIREITGFGLKESKEFIENLPSTIADLVEKDRAEELEQKLTEAGATVVIK